MSKGGRNTSGQWHKKIRALREVIRRSLRIILFHQDSVEEKIGEHIQLQWWRQLGERDVSTKNIFHICRLCDIYNSCALTIICIALPIHSHRWTNNVIERYNWDVDNLFDSPNPGLFVFCKWGREEAAWWEKRHEDALKGVLQTDRGGRKCLGQRNHVTLMSGSQRRKQEKRGQRNFDVG